MKFDEPGALLGAIRLPSVAFRLEGAHDFVAVSRVVLELSTQVFGVHQCAVMLNATSGRPLLAMDNVPKFTDEGREQYFREAWVTDPYLTAMRERQVAIGEELMSTPRMMLLAQEWGYTGDYVHTFMTPLLEPSGMIGHIRWGHLRAFAPELRRDLTAFTTHVSVRLAQLGIAVIDEAAGLAQLTPRQFDVAQLAARGRTNAQIAKALVLSENTVKKHLKEVFARVQIANRTELAVLLARTGPRDALPRGLSRSDDYVITKA